MPLQMIGVSLTGSFPQGIPAIGEMLDNVRRVERLGFDALWSGDHIVMYSPIMDVMTVLASFAAITTRVKIGTAVYLMPLRHPVATAKQVASLDVLSGGRFIFGVGVGGEIVREFEAVGVPVHERGRAGMSNLAFSFTCPADQVTAQLEWCAAELLPRLRQ